MGGFFFFFVFLFFVFLKKNPPLFWFFFKLELFKAPFLAKKVIFPGLVRTQDISPKANGYERRLRANDRDVTLPRRAQTVSRYVLPSAQDEKAEKRTIMLADVRGFHHHSITWM